LLGHSVGEVAAACAAGALDVDTAVEVAFHRSRLQQTVAGGGTMLAVGLSAAEVAPLLGADCSLAAINGPRSVTLAGSAGALSAVAEQLAAAGVFHRPLAVEVAYHSHQMEPLEVELRRSLRGLRPSAPRTPLYSTVTGARVDAAVHDAAYWWRNV